MPDKKDEALAAELLEVQRTLGWMDLVIGNITDAVYVADADARLVFVNQYFSDIVGMPRVFLLGRVLDEVFETKSLGDPNKEFLSEDESSKPTDGRTDIYEWKINDRVKVFKISCRYISTIKQTVYIAKDITTEYELSVMKTNFINIASHQLRTPMTAIMTYSHMLYDGYGGKIGEDQKKLVNSIVVSSERMIALINDILLISRVQNGEANFHEKDSTLKDVFGTLENELESSIQAKNITFIKNIGKKTELIKCNSFLVNEIVSNLLTNAIQYTPDGGKIKLTAKIKSKEVLLCVQDNGIGIPAEYIPKIFNQFTRAENAFEVFNEGTGLGLYVVKIIVDQMGGKINCVSQVNKGTTFTVTFPV